MIKSAKKSNEKYEKNKNKNEEAAGVGIVTKQNATVDVPVGGEYQNVKKLFPKKKKKTKEDNVQELVVKQQRPKIDVINNIATRKDNNPFPLSYKDTGNQTASTGGKLFIAPADADKFIKFYDTRAEDEQELMQKALKSMKTANKLFTNLGIKVRVEPSNYNEGDLVLDRSALIAHLQREIEKFAREEDDVEKLSYILKQLSGQKVKARNKKYFTVSDEDIKEALRRVAHGY